MNPFEYVKGTGEDQVINALANDPGCSVIAGGTNLLDLWKYNLRHLSTVIDVNPLPAHHELEELPDGGIRLGAFMTNADTAWHPVIETRYPLLSQAILAGASPQIRNMATNGGNLLQRTRCLFFYDAETPCNKRNPGSGCSAIGGYNRNNAILGTSEQCIATYPSDMSVGLAALDATVRVRRSEGEREIPFLEFHRLPGDQPEKDNTLKPGELIVSIDLPKEGFPENYSYLKIRDRNSYAFALVSVGTALKLEDGLIKDARIALGGVAHKPWRMPEAEQVMIGKPPEAGTFLLAAEILLQGARGFGFNDFKIELARRAIVRNGEMALDPTTHIPGAGPSK